jgi:transposase
MLWPYWGASLRPDHGESRQAHPPWCAQRPERRGTLADHRGVGPRNSSGLLSMIRSHWRGWHIVLFEDRGSPHTAGESLRLAGELHIKLRFLPKATPELNAMDHLWRHVKGRGLANRATQSIDESADSACRYILDMSRRERLRKAGVLSGNFWLTKGLFCQRTF